MSYQVEFYKNKSLWLANRGIGGTDLVNLIDYKSKYSNFIELYDYLVNHIQKAETESQIMENGRNAEKHIRDLFLIENQNFKKEYNDENIVLMRRTDYREITLSPDCIVRNENGILGFVEIKYLQIESENDIQNYLTNLKYKAPHYYWQVIHYFIVNSDIEFGYFVPCFNCRKEQRLIIESLWFCRSDIAQDIELGEKALIDFITNNVRPQIRPQVKLENDNNKGVKIEWSKLSNIKN